VEKQVLVFITSVNKKGLKSKIKLIYDLMFILASDFFEKDDKYFFSLETNQMII
jgi:hypothetical protein